MPKSVCQMRGRKMVAQPAHLGQPGVGMGTTSQRRYMYALPCHSAIAEFLKETSETISNEI